MAITWWSTSTAFLDEAFAGLVRQGIVSADRFFELINIKSERDPSYIEDIEIYVRDARTH